MKDPIADFKSMVVHTPQGAVQVYHVGALGADISSSPTLTNIQMFTYGLYLMGRIGLRQKRITFDTTLMVSIAPRTEYSFVVLQQVSHLDFDTARKTYLDSLRA